MEDHEKSFEIWWHNEGSKPPKFNNDSDDVEEHTKKMCKIAWENGAYVQAELDKIKI